MTVGEARHDEQTERQPRRLALLWAWVMLVVLYFAWESAAYRGIFALVAEWQFDHLGQDLPTFNFSLLTMLFAWPALLLFRRREAKASFEQPELADEEEQVRIDEARLAAEGKLAVSAAQDYMHFLFGFASALALAALVALAWTLALPATTGKPIAIQPNAIGAAPPPEGPVHLEGQINYGRIASFGRGILLFNRLDLYAPVLPVAGSDGLVRYFVEFLPAERADIRNGAALIRRNGVLVRGALPGALIRLYRYLGYRPANQYYVLYASAETMRWPYYMMAAQFAVGAIGFLGFALLQKRRRRKLGELLEKERFRRADRRAAAKLRLTTG